MAESRQNKFINQIKKNNTPVTSTEEIVEKLYQEKEITEEKITETLNTPLNSPIEIKITEEATNIPQTNKKGVGRPKTRSNEKYTQMCICVPESLRTEISKAIICRKTNKNNYILDLIKNDIKINGNDYNRIINSLNKFN